MTDMTNLTGKGSDKGSDTKGVFPIPNLVDPLNKVTSTIDQIVQGLGKITAADLNSAIAVAKAGNDTVAEAGFGALLTLITSMQASDAATAAEASGPHLVTDFAKIRLVALALRPGSAFNTAFAPLANEVKQDVMTAVAAIAGGTITLASFGL